jgi:hypothetical protein
MRLFRCGERARTQGGRGLESLGGLTMGGRMTNKVISKRGAIGQQILAWRK